MKKICLLAFIAVLLASCSGSKHIAYIQNSDSISFARSAVLYDARIMPKDILSITVSTVNPEASAPFNMVIDNQMTTGGALTRLSSSGRTLIPYLVDNSGYINFPVVGQLKVSGLTKNECEKLIHDKIKRFMNSEEDPIVTVRMSNYKISVLGEVNRPGMFTVGNEKINIFEALAQAGDLTIYGVRTNVKLIREDASGLKNVVTLNLNDAEIINSPYYYLQQNDVVYVEPNKVKSKNSAIGQSTTIWISVTGTLVSLASLLVNILRK